MGMESSALVGSIPAPAIGRVAIIRSTKSRGPSGESADDVTVTEKEENGQRMQRHQHMKIHETIHKSKA